MQQSEIKEILDEEIWPGADIGSNIGSNTLDDAIRKHARTIYHPAGTCRMGPSVDAVVDLNLKVNGIEGLRVADCSVMPTLVSGNTNAPTMMIAHRAVSAILSD
jgi:choline dehydrogenase-like flavoprotein